MATISSTGIGSGLDINSLVTQLVAAERAAPEQRINRDTSKVTTEFTAMATLKGAMSSFQAAVNALKGADAFAPRKATVSDEEAFTASVTSKAAAGNYDVEVVQLATAARVGSALFPAGPDSVVGTGTLTVAMGDKSFSVDITSDNSLAAIRDAINSSKDNPGVRATLIRDTSGSGSYLVLSGSKTGADNAITVSSTGADAGLAQLVTDFQTVDPDRDVTAQDAIVFVSGYEIHSDTNKVSGAIDGVTLSLKKAEDGALVSLNVERDDATIQKRAETFVSAYNVLAQQIASLSRYDATTKTGGPLLGDSMLRSLDSQVRRILSQPVAGATGGYTTLASLGITTNVNGTLQLDASRFSDALAADPDAVSRIFTATDSGVAPRLADFLQTKLSSTGEFAARDQRIADKRRDLAKQTDALDVRMEMIQARYMKQFTALDSMLSQLQSTSSYLSQQTTSLQNLNK